MANEAEDALEDLFEARGEVGEAGFRIHTLTVVRSYETGEHTGDQVGGFEETPITEGNGQPPKIRWLKPDEIALGNYPSGTVVVGPITPEHAGGGTPDELLTGTDLQTKDTLRFIIRGPNHPNGWRYRKVGFSAERSLRRMLYLAPLAPGEP